VGQKVKFLAGDFGKTTGEVGRGKLAIGGRVMPLTSLGTVEIATEESVKRAGGTIGWGAAGAVLLGPVGLLAGLLLGGRGKEITFVAVLRDGRKILGTTTSKGYQEMLAATFKTEPVPKPRPLPDVPAWQPPPQTPPTGPRVCTYCETALDAAAWDPVSGNLLCHGCGFLTPGR
jgi:hypothetical protein